MINGYVHPAFAEVATAFRSMFRTPKHGGGAFAVTVRGEPVVDIWSGWTDPTGGTRWAEDTMALSFSTTKGVITTLLHRVFERRGLGYDLPVAELWPAFAQAGKQDVTVRELLGHGAGLHRIRGVVRDPAALLDHTRMTALLAARPFDPARRGTAGYHALTFGWLLTGLLEAITGEDVRETLHRELAGPLELDGLWFGAPASERHRVAHLFPSLAFDDETVRRMSRAMGALRPARGLRDAAVIDGFAPLVFGRDGAIHDTAMASVNGIFTARSLARLYAFLACGGTVGGTGLLSPERTHSIGRVQYRNRDFVLALPMRWRLGYHQAFTLSRQRPRRAFGHFGAGGSGAWADPDLGLSVAFVTNRMGSVSTPVGDLRLVRLGAIVHAAARQVARPLHR